MNLISIALFCIGLVALLKGADIFTESSAKIARHFGISELVIGLTLVAFATSLPELAISSTASFFGSSGIALGNVIGSNIANIGLVIGISAIIAPLAIKKKEVAECMVMFILLVIASLYFFNDLVWWEGLTLFIFLIVYVWSVLRGRKIPKSKRKHAHLSKCALLCIIGVIGIIIGSRFVVDSAVELARWAGISELVIGLTLIAVGTSLPELATSLVAAVKGRQDIALGNIIGSNVFNIAAVLGISSIIRTIPVYAGVLMFDVPVMILLAGLMLLFMATRHKIGKAEGAVLLLVYLGFLYVQLFVI